jgi:putative photosynthetic complex assembly protein
MSGAVRPQPSAFADDEPDAPMLIPRPLLIGAGLLMLCTLLLAAYARFTGAGRLEQPVSAAVKQRSVVFQQLPGNVVRVVDGTTNAVIVTFPEGQGGFVRGSLRAFAYSRHVKGVALDAEPFILSAWEDGRLTLDDPATGSRIQLDAFGSDNRAAFASLLRD